VDLTAADDGRPATPILPALRRRAEPGPARRPVPGPPPARPPPPVAARPQLSDRLGVILIGASTGGVEALHRILADFPPDCPPTLVVQHIRGAFSAAFAERLNRVCRAEVAEAAPDRLLAPGLILVAPGDRAHLELRGPAPLRCQLTEAPPLTGHRPSVDALFRSAAPLGHRAVGVLLTGMGQDGARGLKQIREAGGHTIAQDRETSVIYGMPRIAADLGAAVEVLGLDRIAGAILAAAGHAPAAGKAAVRP
jgi:two-component system chemotaxis response regulator CheB